MLYDGHMTVHRFGLMGERANPILRALRYTVSCIKQYHYGVRTKDADMMFISSTPPIQGAMAALVKKRTGIPILYNLQDIFPDSLVGTGLTHKGSLLWKIGRIIENFTYKNADKIVVISNDFKQNIIAKGVPENKIEVIYNWVDENAVKNIPRDSHELFDTSCLDRNKSYVTYCGHFGPTQNMDLLLEVAKELEEVHDIHFVIIGEGAYKDRVEDIIAEKHIDNVTLIPFQAYEKISEVFSLGDVGLVISKPGVGANSVPSKTWSIMSAERAVLANFDENEMRTIITENRCGIFTSAADKNAFREGILWLYNNRAECIEYGKNGRRFIMNNLTRKAGTERYVACIKETFAKQYK